MNLRQPILCTLLLALISPLVSFAAEPAATPAPDVASLQREIEDLKRLLPGQAHVMSDVDHQYGNLWFAARAKNWPLATFYMNESRLRIAWAVRIRPVRPLPGGGEIDLRPLQTHIEQSAYADLKAALEKHDVKAFEVAYKKGLGECLDCHKAIDKAFLRPAVPKSPGASVIAVEPE
ncbi:MAG: hypothetical protein ABL964_00380 [Steroidobacteraceae bacterium]